ncbi:DUF4867 family protein [Salibacterium salarium]|uniref:DUF4867 family protein n=1 Tax=Salibacterium salarium TaxID=284579 RepID=A0A428N594_9BACI|nr:DUF4867 family protein [Salibacterium salarium]RSL33506.1 DUF4867 family protein [Salibacterium salarium]
MLDKLQSINTHLRIHHVTSDRFMRFGNVLEDFPIEDSLTMMKETAMPAQDNMYVPKVEEWKDGGFQKVMETDYYGGMPVQIGYCNGNNSNLNGLEFHKGSEINVAATDFILLLGSFVDITNQTFDTDHIEAFYIPEKTAVELYQTTLHLAPCKTSADGFKCMVILPEGTNYPLPVERNEQDILFMKNKWLLSHPDNEKFMEKGAYPGITGPNIHVQSL